MVQMETIKIYLKIYTANMSNVTDNIKNILHAIEFDYWHCYDSQTNLVFNSIKAKIKMELNLDPHMYELYFNDLNDSPSSFNLENTNLLYQEFSPIRDGKLKFYIRIEKSFHYILFNHLNIQSEERNEIQQETQEEPREEICPVCLDPQQTHDFLTQYRCSHIICRTCYSECISHQRYTCSLCRAPNILQHYILTQI
jgi:hypothetical protein